MRSSEVFFSASRILMYSSSSRLLPCLVEVASARMAPMWIRPADGALVARNAQRAWAMETTLAAPRTWHTDVRLRPKVESKSSRFPISDAARTPLVWVGRYSERHGAGGCEPACASQIRRERPYAQTEGAGHSSPLSSKMFSPPENAYSRYYCPRISARESLLKAVHSAFFIIISSHTSWTLVALFCSRVMSQTCTARPLSTGNVTLNDGNVMPMFGLGVFRAEPGESTYNAVRCTQSGAQHGCCALVP